MLRFQFPTVVFRNDLEELMDVQQRGVCPKLAALQDHPVVERMALSRAGSDVFVPLEQKQEVTADVL